MRARHIAILLGLGISVFTAFYLLTLLVVTEVIDIPIAARTTIHVPTAPAQSLVEMPLQKPQPTPPPMPTRSFEDGLSVTDPRLVVLDENDVPRDMKVTREHTRYVDNAKLIANSDTPHQTQEALTRKDRLNGFQTAFASNDPVASRLRNSGILNFAEIYGTPAGARQALQDTATRLTDCFPYDGQLLFEREVSLGQPVGQEARAFEGLLVTGQDRIPAYAIIFYRKNTLVGIVLLGEQKDRLAKDNLELATLLDRRVRDFGKGSAA